MKRDTGRVKELRDDLVLIETRNPFTGGEMTVAYNISDVTLVQGYFPWSIQPGDTVSFPSFP
jgi:hypothetical protein